MIKIPPEHLSRAAVVYVRLSTVRQVTNNLESQRRQYGLVEGRRSASLRTIFADPMVGSSGRDS